MRLSLVVITLFMVVICYSQQTHIITLSSNQPPLLVANAGDDLILSNSNNVQLGGNPSVTGGASPYTYEWTPVADLTDPSISNPSFITLTDSRVYTLVVTDINNCTAVDEIDVTLNPLSVIQGDKISIYPTVGTSYFTIEAMSTVEQVKVYDGSGRELLDKSIHQTSYQLNATGLESGFYVLRVKTGMGWSSFKIVVE